ncbi:hypothetical protein H6F87_28725 [Cyanobacteria bacterium FACHB-502]|nr:hypothetical protein [Cyanobacteria bacterium FACHB-502]
MRRWIDRLDVSLNCCSRRVLQIGVVAAVWGVTYLDLKQPGYLQFYDPIPWSAIDQLIGNWGECPAADAIKVPGIPSIVRFLQMPSTLEDWRRRLGQPTCYSNENGKEIYIWKLQALFNQQLFLRIEFQQNAATGYEFLRQQ